jgi:3-deoxy-D-manno-octulosonate 8-phosphate phosphatase (KDO 8-P phosphatase)
MLTKSQIIKKCKSIKLVITDVDGVLTDGGMYYSSRGEIMKKFNTRDGMAVELLKDQNIQTIMMTRENSLLVKKRAEKIKVDNVYLGIKQKKLQLIKICKKYNLKNHEIAFIGDDVNDLEIILTVGFSASPNDGINLIKKNVDYLCKKNGGHGAFREFCDLIILMKSI